MQRGNCAEQTPHAATHSTHVSVSAYALTRKAHTPTTRDNHRQNICSDLSHDALCEHFLSNLSNEGINLCACSGRFVHAPGRICEPGVGRRRRHHRSGAAPAAHRGDTAGRGQARGARSNNQARLGTRAGQRAGGHTATPFPARAAAARRPARPHPLPPVRCATTLASRASTLLCLSAPSAVVKTCGQDNES